MKIRVPRSWGRGRRRVDFPHLLIESDDPVLAISDFNAFLQAGFNPAFCGGPAPDHRCPLLEGGRCELIDEADVVLNRMHRPTELVGAIRASRPGLPVVVVAPGAEGVLATTATVNEQIRVLRRQLYRARTWTPTVGAPGIGH